MKQLIQRMSDALYETVRAHYRYLHAHPELSFNEVKTAKYVCDVLDRLDVPYRKEIGGNGVVARLACSNPTRKTIALRADMDALPIQEETGLPYASVHPRVMHACGHDAHTSVLLGVVEMFVGLSTHLEGTYLFIFQPGEEKHPGGARLMINDHLFDELTPDCVIAQHVYVDIPCGHVAVGSGTVMASADEIHLTVRGKGGHGALPHLLNDTVLAASQIVVSIQQVVSRLSNPFNPMVVTFGKIIADGATNIIPDQVLLSGTMRCMDPQERVELRERIKAIILHTAQAYGCEVDISMPEGYPPTVNNHTLAAEAKMILSDLLGAEAVHPLVPRMTAEDFGFFTQRYPSLFYRFGIIGESNKETTGLHTSHFRIDEEGLRTGLAGMAYLAATIECEGRV